MFCLIHKNKFDGKLKGMVHQVIYENDHTFFFPRHIRRYYDYSYIDGWVDPKFSIVKPKEFKFTSKLRDAQVDMSADIFDSFAETGYIHGIIQARPGTGKCFKIDTPILMYDGSIKMVQDIINGDLVMGPDSKPRIASGVNVGYGDMYEVIPDKGDSFTCNYDHILSLKSSYHDSKQYPFDSITNISIKDYLKQTNRFKAKMKLWRTGVEFPTVDILFDPYIIGAHLGDGTKKEICSIRNDFRFYVKEHLITENNERNIPNEYLINDREVRLQLLAGIIDTNGNLSSDGYEVFCKDEHFADQICFLSRSLGYACYKKEKVIGTEIHYKCFISGYINEIPCEYKKAPECKQIKDVLKTGFEVKYIGKDNYYGFTLDKDHLYLMGDFTVTHNTVLGIYLAHKLNVVTLIVIDNKKIVEQWIDEMLRHTDLERSDIGTIKGDVFDVDDKVIIVSTPQTLSSKFKNANKTFYPKFRDIGVGLVIWDECKSGDTELLTEHGWQRFDKLDKSVKVAQFNHITREISFVKPLRYIENDYKGKLVHLKSRNIDDLSTPNHEQPLYLSGKYEKRIVDNVKFNYYTKIPIHGKGVGDLEFTDYHRFLIMLQADGTIQYETKDGDHYQVCFTFSKQRKIDRLKQLVESLGYSWGISNDTGSINENVKDRTRFMIYPKDRMYKHFNEWLDISNISYEFANKFINELVLWDGSTKGGNLYYSTTDSGNADIVQIVALFGGYKCSRGIQIDNRKESYKDVHRFYFYKDVDAATQSIKKDYVDYDGKVYCVTVPDGNIIVRRNNKVSITGNCHVIANEWAAGSLLFNTPNLLGMSATPWHGKDKEILMYSIFGEVVTKYGEYDFSPKYKMVEYDSLTGDKDGKRVNYLWKNNFNMARSVYNRVLLKSKAWVDICVEIMKYNMEADPNNRMIVIVFTEKQINVLYDAAIKAGLEPIKFYAKQREVDKDKDRLLIATMAYGSKAFDYKQLNRMLLAIPILGKKAMVQSIGRILRECSGKVDAEVWDLYDMGSGYRGLFLNTIDQKLRIINNEYDDVIIERGSIEHLTK